MLFLRMIAPLFAAAIFVAFALVTPARAEVYYPWCAMYGGGNYGAGTTVCSFNTFEQCRATVSGMGGMCQQNPASPDMPGRSPRKRR